MKLEDGRDLRLRLAAARRRLIASDRLVEVGAGGRRRRWRSVLDPSTDQLERAAATAIDGGDLSAAMLAVERLERHAARASQDARRRP